MNFKQRKILKKLVSRNGQKYSELLEGFSEEDKFPYHLKFLMQKLYIEKREASYYITPLGMKVTGRFDTRSLDESEGITARVEYICKYKNKYYINIWFPEDKNRKTFYTVPGLNPNFGESISDIHSRFEKKYSIKGEYKYLSTIHSMYLTEGEELLFHNFTVVFEAKVIRFEDKIQRNEWMTIREIQSLKNVGATLKEILIDGNKNKFIESEVISNIGLTK